MSRRILLLLLFVAFAVLVLPNARALYEGIAYYLFPAVTYHSTPVQMVSRTGRFASITTSCSCEIPNGAITFSIISIRRTCNVNRSRFPIPKLLTSSPTFTSTGPYTIYCAHYDKYYDDVNYQGASDNTPQ